MIRLTRPHSETEAELLKDSEYVKALSLELDETVKELERLRTEIAELKQERDKMERALKKMISMYVVDDYIYGEDRLNEINKRFERMMREA